MHTIQILFYICLYKLRGLIHEVTAEATPNLQLFPQDLFAFGNYEILNVRNEGDEDVVHIRKRAGQEDCGTDCLDYSGWTENGLMQCEDNEGEDVPEKRALLEKRGRKETNVCKGLKLDDPLKEIKLISPTWPQPGTLEKKYGIVYDTGDPTKPLKEEWFQLQQRKQRWTEDLVGRTSKGNNKPKRCYAAEHVLEWQLLKRFIEADKDSMNSRCWLLFEFLSEPMPKGAFKVKVAKNDGKLDKDNHFEYEDKDHSLDKWKHEVVKVPRVIDWISNQWPGKANGITPNPWEYELVLYNQDANGKKKDVWAGFNLVSLPQVNGVPAKMKEVQENSKTLEWLFENKYFDGGMKTWNDNKGKCKAIYQFMTLMNIAQYHNQALIQEIMRAQVRRVGEAWELVEKNFLTGRTFTETDPDTGAQKTMTYQYRNLKKEWLDWMKEEHKIQLEGLTRMLKNKLEVFQGDPGVITKLKRWDYGGIFRREVDEPNCGTGKDHEMKKRVDLLIKEYKKMTPVESVLTLD
ncbi:hypothetical protein GQ44DRAFT_776460 [Phaeosphaeriaceae sp. PMI808]|nr:hypothetical protein GQ44DRAFT_776460 [Phaeosphaeriaceae sp. PMI808]